MSGCSRQGRTAHRRRRGRVAVFVAALVLCVAAQPLFAGAILVHTHGEEGSHTHRVALQAAAAKASGAVSAHAHSHAHGHGHGHRHDLASQQDESPRLDARHVYDGEVFVAAADLLLLGRGRLNGLSGLDCGMRSQLANLSAADRSLDPALAGVSDRPRCARDQVPDRSRKTTAALLRTSAALLL